MKYLVYLFIFIPIVAIGQFDFETRYFKIDAQSLPEMPEISTLDFDFGATPNFEKKHISDYLKVTAKNYWQPVDMASVLSKESEMTSLPSFNVPTINQREFGFSFSVNGSNSFDGTTSYGIKNTVYKEMRSVYFCSPSGNYPSRSGN